MVEVVSRALHLTPEIILFVVLAISVSEERSGVWSRMDYKISLSPCLSTCQAEEVVRTPVMIARCEGGDSLQPLMLWRMSRKERNLDSGLVVVVFIISSLIITVFSFLLFVDYEWCPVLFKNNTENPACTKSDNRDKVLLTSSMADQKEENKRYRETHHQIFSNGAETEQSSGQ